MKNQLLTKKFMNEIADAITKNTGIKNSFAMKDGSTLVYDFDLGNSYMTNNGGNSLYFALTDENGSTYSEICSADVRQFIQQVTYVINKCNFG